MNLEGDGNLPSRGFRMGIVRSLQRMAFSETEFVMEI